MKNVELKFIAVVVIAAIGFGPGIYDRVQKQLDARAEYYAGKTSTPAEIENLAAKGEIDLCKIKIAGFEKNGPTAYSQERLKGIEECKKLVAQN